MRRLTFPEHDIEGARHTLAYRQYRLSYEVYGAGDRVLVWMHGLLLDANLSRGLARRLAAKGNRVVLLDLLGHGRSDKPRHAGPPPDGSVRRAGTVPAGRARRGPGGSGRGLAGYQREPARHGASTRQGPRPDSGNAGARVGGSGGCVGVRAAPAGGPLRPGRAAAGL